VGETVMVNINRDTLQYILKVHCRVKVGTGEANIGMIQAEGLAAWATKRVQERDS